MQAYHNDPAVKEKYVQRMQEHRDLDQVMHGTYWQDGKGCAVGCTVHSESHRAFERELGIPIDLVYLEEFLFESMRNASALDFPLAFLKAVPVGANLSRVRDRLLQWLLTDPDEAVQRHGSARTRQLAARLTGKIERNVAGDRLPDDALSDAIRQHAFSLGEKQSGPVHDAAMALYAASNTSTHNVLHWNGQSFQKAAHLQGVDSADVYEESLCRVTGSLLRLLAAAPVPVAA